MYRESVEIVFPISHERDKQYEVTEIEREKKGKGKNIDDTVRLFDL